MLGTNGGGFFSANSAHPYENPTSCSHRPLPLSSSPPGSLPPALERQTEWAPYSKLSMVLSRVSAASSSEQTGTRSGTH